MEMQEILVIAACAAAAIFAVLRIRKNFQKKKICDCNLCPERNCSSRAGEFRSGPS